MTIVDGSPQGGLVTRIKNIILKPSTEWEVIDAEPATIKGLYTGYAMILAAIGPIAGLIGGQLFGVSFLGFSAKPPLISAIGQAIVMYALSLGMIYVLALIIDALAPSFDGTKNRVQAFKVAVYASTASWLAGIFGLLPAISFLAILGLYSLYLLFLGLPRLMKAPREKALGYTAVTIIVALVLNLIVGVVVGGVMATTKIGMGSGALMGAGSAGTISIPGGGSIDLQKLEQAGKQIEAAAQQNQAAQGGAPINAVDPTALEDLLPAALPGYTRTKVSSGGGSVAGLGGTTAGAVYDKGESQIELQVTDMGAMGALAGAFNVSANERTATGYEKVGQVNGRTVTEKYDTTDQSGHYGVLVGGRFMVQATGRRVAMDEMKAAVAAVPEARLAGL